MKRNAAVLSVITIGLSLVAAGCGHRDAPPATPSINTSTPTYRSTTNSYEANNSPRYTQSGVNGGEPATLPAIASPDRFSENTPLATAVYNSIRVDPKLESRYVSVYSKGSEIKLAGTISKTDLPALLDLVKKQPGVKSVDYTKMTVR